MSGVAKVLGLGALLACGLVGQGQAQYADRPYGYEEPEPRAYGEPEPRVYEEPREFGGGRGLRCDTLARTPTGPQHVICDLGEPRRLARPCGCPPPEPPPGYAPGLSLRGRVVR